MHILFPVTESGVDLTIEMSRTMKNTNVAIVQSQDSGQFFHRSSRIRVFAVGMNKAEIVSY